MLYLEDYLEMIEHLPQELRDRFTEMRELDLTVQNSMDSLEKKTRLFFQQCKRGELQNEAADMEFQNLRKEYYKVLEDADEKVTIATQIHELVERYLRRLDSELFKFKCELEADNNGITEILEKRSLELDGCSAAAMIGMGQKENRYFGSLSSNNHSGGGLSLGGGGLTQPKDNRYRPKPEKRRDSSSASLASVVEKRPNLGNSIMASTAATPVTAVRPLTPNLGSAHHSVIAPASAATGTASSVAYNLQHMGGAGNAIAAAASQAIVATQQMQQGRRTASLKASYEAIHGATSGSTSHEFWINRDLGGASSTQNSLQSADRDASGNLHGQQASRKQKKKMSGSLVQQTANAASSSISIPSSSSSLSSHADSTSSSADLLPSSSSNTTGITIIGSNTLASGTASAAVSNRNSSSSAVQVSTTPVTPENGLVVEQTAEGEWSYDPNEPRYCTCNQVSYGDMVACDNDACPYEWFHYPCVGITQPPKGKWYCPKCTASMRRRGNRKN